MDPSQGGFQDVVSVAHLVQADLPVGDLEDGVAVLLVLLDGLVHVLALVGQLHSGHGHLGRAVGVPGRAGEQVLPVGSPLALFVRTSIRGPWSGRVPSFCADFRSVNEVGRRKEGKGEDPGRPANAVHEKSTKFETTDPSSGCILQLYLINASQLPNFIFL